MTTATLNPQLTAGAWRRRRPWRAADACSSEPRSRVERAKTPLNILILGGTGFTGPGAGRVRDRAWARGHADQSQQDAARLLQGSRRTADRRLNGDMSALKGRKFDVVIDNPTTAAGVGAERGAVPEGQHEALHLHLDDFRLRQRQDSVGRRNRPTHAAARRPRSVHAVTAGRCAQVLRPAQGVTRRRKSRSTIRACNTIIRPGLIVGPLDAIRSLHLLAISHRQGR